jgi:hypothetical protein
MRKVFMGNPWLHKKAGNWLYNIGYLLKVRYTHWTMAFGFVVVL